MVLRTVAFAAIVAGVTGGGGAHAGLPVALHVESLSQRWLQVEVSSRPAGLRADSASSDSTRSKLVVRTPALVFIADSVREVRVIVLGAGAVRLRLEGGASQQERRLALWGRDVTLRRVEGVFRPVTKVIPLEP